MKSAASTDSAAVFNGPTRTVNQAAFAAWYELNKNRYRNIEVSLLWSVWRSAWWAAEDTINGK